MNDHERVHIDGLVREACDLLCETSIQRCHGVRNALRQLREDPDGDGVWLDRFVTMFLGEHALDTVAGACTILEAHERRPMPAVPMDGSRTIGETLRLAGRESFTELVRQKADEALELASIHEAVPS